MNEDWKRLMELRQAAGYDDARGNPIVRRARATEAGKCVLCWAPYQPGDTLVLEGPLPRHEMCVARRDAAERAVMTRKSVPSGMGTRPRRMTIEQVERAAAGREQLTLDDVKRYA